METDICHAVLVGDEVLFLWDILWEFFLPEQPYTITRLLHLPSFQPRDPPPSFPLEPPQLNLLLNLPLVSQVRNGLQSHWFIPSTQVSVIPLGKKKKRMKQKSFPVQGGERQSKHYVYWRIIGELTLFLEEQKLGDDLQGGVLGHPIFMAVYRVQVSGNSGEQGTILLMVRERRQAINEYQTQV